MGGQSPVYSVKVGLLEMNDLVPMTWYLTRSQPFHFPYGDEGRLFHHLPFLSFRRKTGSTIVRFRIRLADQRDVEHFHFSLILTPDESFVDIIKVRIRKDGIYLGH